MPPKKKEPQTHAELIDEYNNPTPLQDDTLTPPIDDDTPPEDDAPPAGDTLDDTPPLEEPEPNAGQGQLKENGEDIKGGDNLSPEELDYNVRLRKMKQEMKSEFESKLHSALQTQSSMFQQQLQEMLPKPPAPEPEPIPDYLLEPDKYATWQSNQIKDIVKQTFQEQFGSMQQATQANTQYQQWTEKKKALGLDDAINFAHEQVAREVRMANPRMPENILQEEITKAELKHVENAINGAATFGLDPDEAVKSAFMTLASRYGYETPPQTPNRVPPVHDSEADRLRTGVNGIASSNPQTHHRNSAKNKIDRVYSSNGTVQELIEAMKG